MNTNKIIHYDSNQKKLSGTILSKAKRFVSLNKVIRLTLYMWKIEPIKGYNKTTHYVEYSPIDHKFICDCQYNQITGRTCSHIQAVLLKEGIKNE